MSKALIAVVNARHRKEWRDAVRSTWKPLVPKDRADALFFVGRGAPLEESDRHDVVELDCDDAYMGLPEKIRAIMRWAHSKDYHHALKCDDDVVMNPTELLNSGYDAQEYSGPANRIPTNVTPFWVPMGFCYWVSRRAMTFLLDAPLPTEGNDDERWVALNLHNAGISLAHDQRYKLQYGHVTRPLRPQGGRALRRPLSTDPYKDLYEGTFAWCVFLEGNSGNTIPIERKISEFHKIFVEKVSSAEGSKN
jgi:hypothetical protein